MSNIKSVSENKELYEVSALKVARYLLSLDPQRKYFSTESKLDEDKKYKSKPTVGNFRLNKMLQLIQALHYAHYKKPLFRDKIKAYEHGGIVHPIYKNFWKLHQEKTSGDLEPLQEEQKKFINKVFYYLRNNYSDNELRDLAHEDLAWMKAWKRKSQGKKDEFIYDKEVLNYYEKLSGSMLRAMKIKAEW